MNADTAEFAMYDRTLLIAALLGEPHCAFLQQCFKVACYQEHMTPGSPQQSALSLSVGLDN